MAIVKPGYQSQASDTSLETDVYEFALLRQKSNSDRFLMTTAFTSSTRRFCVSGLYQRHPNLTEAELAPYVAKAFLGLDAVPFPITGTVMTWIQDSNELALLLHNLLTEIQVPYYITGGVASSTYGEVRATRDLDIVFTLEQTQLSVLVSQLEANGFYVPGVEDLRDGRVQTLSITHQVTISRCDLVLAQDSKFDRLKFARRQLINIIGYGSVYFASPEDLVLNKLRWGQRSNSEKQWRDVIGILKVQGQALDFDYLFQWAETLDLTEALSQAIIAAGLTTER
ncbi:hypothetical protein H6F76_09730 [Leptolyngbya sp. FACHB-321]|uniref:hypothetical protein n=1 Tax=Leptolyngbya sp. FACHB-321 TaxID=2692807 RepID=UPI001686F306|nr:hypothetical protein [Leptolyngbya sp. FACHB-321]MBD2035305.1 hypothetical protein [Leptolyngbya sp. FACHB-321]